MPADAVVEEVPRFRRRYGDQAFEGSNNTLIVLGTDRAKKGPASIDDGLGHVDASGKGKGTGTIHMVVGRKKADPDFQKDDAFIYVTQKSKVDDNLDLGSVESATNDKSAAILKADLLRLVARKNLKICVNDDQKHYVFMDGEKFKVNFNTNATIEIVDKKITVTMGSNKIILDSGKAHVEVNSTKLTLDGQKIKIDSPKVQLTGGCEAPWNDLFEAILEYIDMHNNIGASGPTGPGQAGPSSVAKKISAALKKSLWDQKVKS